MRRMLGECAEQVSRVSLLYSPHYGIGCEAGTLGTGGTLVVSVYTALSLVVDQSPLVAQGSIHALTRRNNGGR
jgi:hypothetical protein